jgi:hypothetical protein
LPLALIPPSTFFAVDGVDAAGRAGLVRPSVARDKLVALIATAPPRPTGMDACTGAHRWRRFRLSRFCADRRSRCVGLS